MKREEFFRSVLERMGIPIKKSSTGVHEAAAKAGLTTQSLSQFNGAGKVTRGEAAIVLFRAAGEGLPKRAAGSSWADYQRQVVERAVDVGLYSGYEDGSAGTGAEAFEGRFLKPVLSNFERAFGSEIDEVAPTAPAPTAPAPATPPAADTAPPAAPTPPPATTSTTDSDADNVLEDEFVEAAQEAQDARDALEIIKDSLRQYGLEGLSGEAYNMLIEGSSPEAVVLRLRETEQFQERFKGMEMRREAGFPAISPGEYIALERNYKQTMIAAGIPEGFYDSPDDFAAFIGNDVSPNEMSQRVAMAAAAVQSVDPNLKTQLRDLYGIGVENDGELTAYFLDPDRGVNVIEQRLQMEAAGLSSAAVGTLGGGFERDTAERLADLNVQRREITERMQGQRGLTQRLVGEERAVTTSELAAAEFGLDSDATADVKRLRQQRQQRGRREMGSLVTGAGVTGLGRAT